MENTLKDDVLREIRKGNGRLLLHDEIETRPGTFEICPIWETLTEDDIKTPRELNDEIIKENYHLDYLRVAIVSLFSSQAGSDSNCVCTLLTQWLRPTSKRHYLRVCS